MPYTSSLTDKEWAIIEPLLPKKKRTRPPKWSKREILNEILYQLKNGCNWVDWPKDLPPVLVRVPLRLSSTRGSHRYSTVFWHYKQWRKSGTIENIMTALHYQLREKNEKKESGQP